MSSPRGTSRSWSTPAEYTPSDGDRLAKNVGGGNHEFIANTAETRARVRGVSQQSQTDIADEPCQDGNEDSPPRPPDRSSVRPRSASRTPSKDRAILLTMPPKVVRPPAPSKPARPLLLARSPLPAAGSATVACRHPALGSIGSRARAPPAAFLAGAIASGRPLPKLPAKADGVQTAGSDGNAVLSAMAQRLSQVEKLNSLQSGKLAKQSQELDALHAELAVLRKIADAAEQLAADTTQEGVASLAAAAPHHSDEDFEALRAERDHLQEQVEDMTKFLEDYGLIWVGDADKDDGDGSTAEGDDDAEGVSSLETCGSSTSQEASSPAKTSSWSPQTRIDSVTVDIQTMTSRVQVLNDMVERKGACIVSNVVGGAVRARLVADDALPLPLTFFEDGVKLGTLPFHGYHSRDAQVFLRDICDGFFPYALKDTYPEGVAIRVVDRLPHTFEAWLRELAAADPELAEGGERLLPAGGRVLRGGGPPAYQLQRQRLGTGSAAHRDASVPSIPSVGPPPEVSLIKPERGDDEARRVGRIQVKLEGGERIVFVVSAEQTVGDLRDALDRWCQGLPGRESGDKVGSETHFMGNNFLLRSAFPPKTYDRLDVTLQEAGLIPSATLFVSTETLA